MTFSEKLTFAIEINDSMVCVGIDPSREKIPSFLWEKFGKNDVFGVVSTFCIDVIDATAKHCCAFKPNLAFFEAFGLPGWQALEKVLQHIKDNYPDHVLVLDGKRGDIGNTADHYAMSLKALGADAVTVNPYLGPKTLSSFMNAGLGIIALCVTSNKDAAIFQNIQITGIDGQPRNSMYAYVAEVLTQGVTSNEENPEIAEAHSFTPPENWYGQIGLVTGATHPQELGDVRKLVGEDVVLLIPGIGKQAGDLEATVKNNGDGPAMINVSRSVLYASNGEDFTTAAALEAERTKNEINKYRAKLA